MARLIEDTSDAILARARDIRARLAGAPPVERAALREELNDLELRKLQAAQAREAAADLTAKRRRAAELVKLDAEIQPIAAAAGARVTALHAQIDSAIIGRRVLGRRDSGEIRALAPVLLDLAAAIDALAPITKRVNEIGTERGALQRQGVMPEGVGDE